MLKFFKNYIILSFLKNIRLLEMNLYFFKYLFCKYQLYFQTDVLLKKFSNNIPTSTVKNPQNNSLVIRPLYRESILRSKIFQVVILGVRSHTKKVILYAWKQKYYELSDRLTRLEKKGKRHFKKMYYRDNKPNAIIAFDIGQGPSTYVEKILISKKRISADKKCDTNVSYNFLHS